MPLRLHLSSTSTPECPRAHPQTRARQRRLPVPGCVQCVTRTPWRRAGVARSGRGAAYGGAAAPRRAAPRSPHLAFFEALLVGVCVLVSVRERVSVTDCDRRVGVRVGERVFDGDNVGVLVLLLVG